MSKKVFKHKTAKIYLEPDGFSIHTFELSTELSPSEWNKCKDRLYTEQKHFHDIWIYSDKSYKDLHICTRYADAGIRIYLQHTSSRKGSHRYYVRMIVNPRRLIYPQSGYLGILPSDESSTELLEQTFRHLFRKSPFEKDIRKYYLTRVDLCTNIRCDNKKVFRELVRLLRKTATPKKYERKFYQHTNKKKANLYNKHYIRIACGSQELVIYDKTYQMNENDLAVAYENLSSGVLRIEVHYERDKLRCLEKENKTDDPLDLLWLLMQQSKSRICELVKKCYPDQPYLSYRDGLATIDSNNKFSQSAKEAMRTLLTEMQRKQTIDKAFQAMEKQGIKTDGLLKKFCKLGINPIPLREGYGAKRMPSLSAILQTVGNPDKSSVTIELSYQKWK